MLASACSAGAYVVDDHNPDTGAYDFRRLTPPGAGPLGLDPCIPVAPRGLLLGPQPALIQVGGNAGRAKAWAAWRHQYHCYRSHNLSIYVVSPHLRVRRRSQISIVIYPHIHFHVASHIADIELYRTNRLGRHHVSSEQAGTTGSGSGFRPGHSSSPAAAHKSV